MNIDQQAEREAQAIAKHRRMNNIDVRRNGHVSYRAQRSKRSAEYYRIERMLSGG